MLGTVVAIISLTLVVFWPVLNNGFVNWGDNVDIVDNPHFRGLKPANLAWMFTTVQAGHYQPLSWITLAIDYLVWGLEPRGFHLTSLMLHCACAASVLLLTRRILIDLPRQVRSFYLPLLLSATIGAILFAIHPLRVEPVAWATERRGSLSALFLIWSFYFYWQYARSRPISRSAMLFEIGDQWNRQFWLSVAFFGLSLLSKEFAITYPAVLIVVDVYPLRRVAFSSSRLRDQIASIVLHLPAMLKEKVPFIALAAIGAMVAVISSLQSGVAKSVDEFSIPQRLAQAFFGLRLYLEKTLWPTDLSPLYPIPPSLNPWSSQFIVSAVIVVAITFGLIIFRNRWPGLLATWVVAVIFVSPVLGLVQTGHQIAADRYTYLPAIGLSVLAGAAVLRFLTIPILPSHGLSGRACTLAIMSLIVAVALGIQTHRQCKVWRDSRSLWSHAIAADPANAAAHNNLAVVLVDLGDLQPAKSSLQQALEIDPAYIDARMNLAILLAQQGKTREAIGHCRQLLVHSPNHPDAQRLLRELEASGNRSSNP